jgi:hypothetical protein
MTMMMACDVPCPAAPARVAALAASAVLFLLVCVASVSAQSLDGVVRLRALSTAEGREPVAYGSAAEMSAILVNDRVLREPNSEAGLRVAVAKSDGEVLSGFFRVAVRAGEVERLEQFIDAVEPGSGLAISLHRAITPTGPAAEAAGGPSAARERLAALLARIGSRAAPVDRAGVSWAYLALRLDKGSGVKGREWVSLAESASASRGVSISFVLGPDRRRYANYASRVVMEGESRLRLIDRWPTLDPMPDTALAESVVIAGRELPAIFAHPPYRQEVLAEHPDGENRLLFEHVDLGEFPRFTCSIGLREEYYGKSDGVVFSVAVDGEVVATRALSTGAEDPPAWHDWSVDLGKYAGRTVALELRTGPGGNTSYDHAYWGDPAVVSGSPPAQKGPPAADAHRLVFIGHAYPMNGFDKRQRAKYLDWDTSDDTYMTWGKSVRRRIQVERSPAARADFFGAMHACEPERLVWGGDTLYAPGKAANEYLREMLGGMDEQQVVLPGNHDASAAVIPDVLEACVAAAGEEETIGGVRLMYVDSTHSGDRNIVSKALCAPDQPWIDALTGRIAAVPVDSDVYGLVLMLHHAAWITEPGVANVAHSDDWWGREIHPALQALAEAGISVVVIAGDAGDHCMADGRRLDGVTYVVTGQPRFDSDVPNGFVEVGWGPSRPGLAVREHTWTWGREPEVFEPQSDSWRY